LSSEIDVKKDKRTNILINNQNLYDIRNQNSSKVYSKITLISNYFQDSQSFVIEAVSLGKDFYFKIFSFPIEDLSFYLFFLGIKQEDILNKWIKVDQEFIKDLSLQTSTAENLIGLGNLQFLKDDSKTSFQIS